MSYHTVKFHVNAGLDMDQTGVFNAAFEENALSTSCKKQGAGWDFLLTFDHKPAESQLRATVRAAAMEAGISPDAAEDLLIEPLDETRDWLAESYRALAPFSIGPFFIYGSHYQAEIPANLIPLQIDAATAFGSGMHGTTSRCLLALAYLKEQDLAPARLIDMGCGSGILGIAAAKLWPEAKASAADNDPECVRVTLRHMDFNAADKINAYVSEGYAPESPVWKDAPYDLIIANILAGPLIMMAEDQARAVTSGGYLILSGMLQEQAADVARAYEAHGLKTVQEFPGDEWMTLLMRKA